MAVPKKVGSSNSGLVASGAGIVARPFCDSGEGGDDGGVKIKN